MSETALAETPLDELVDDVADRTDEEPESIRRRLDPFTDDGTVTSAAIESTVTDVSQILATAETRVDLATRAHEKATGAAAAAPDLAVVDARRRGFDGRLSDLRAGVDGLAEELGDARGDFDSPLAVYRAAVALHEITTDAQQIVRVAHDLETDLEAFEAWLGSANRRHDGLLDDVEAAEESVAEVTGTVDALRDADDPDPERWFEAAVQARVLDLVVADLRVEAADLRTWADRQGHSFPDGVAERIDALDDEAAATAEALADRPGRDDRFDARLDALEAELSAIEPPVAWERVDETVAEARAALSAGEPDADGGSVDETADR
ncbi:halo transducer protein [Halorubrum sp. FL23]|uniref:halo transducer protein n=1 Tax=Halorubrum sp. FL23 TaxID=3458704 RepID=UPI004034DC55